MGDWLFYGGRGRGGRTWGLSGGGEDMIGGWYAGRRCGGMGSGMKENDGFEWNTGRLW